MNKLKTTQIWWLGCLTGALIFILLYGVKILNPAYDDWIFFTGHHDIMQHYIVMSRQQA